MSSANGQVCSSSPGPLQLSHTPKRNFSLNMKASVVIIKLLADGFAFVQLRQIAASWVTCDIFRESFKQTSAPLLLPLQGMPSSTTRFRVLHLSYHRRSRSVTQRIYELVIHLNKQGVCFIVSLIPIVGISVNKHLDNKIARAPTPLCFSFSLA